ncbi:UbiH/UbiF/VisC/COQ6 family ubiquinone biosynthesis hydroxylase [Roseobacteraceae bacterium S113]
MTQSTDLIIVGGGLTGPLMALAAAQAGLRSVVIDRSSESLRKDAAFDGRSYALAAASQKLLSALGLWDALAPHAQPMLEIKVSDGRAGEGPAPFFVHFDHAETQEGPMGYMLEDRHLRRHLLETIAGSEMVETLEGTVIRQDVEASSVTVSLSDGRSVKGALLLGCDGRGSQTAERAGITRVGRDYGQTALVCAIAHEKPHQGIAHQFFMPSGPLAILPLTGNRSSIVWSEARAQAKAIHDLGDAEYLEVLRPRFGDFLGDIALAGQRYSYPLTLTIASRFVAERVALVGDAAHGVHPIAGQGLNAGFRDIASLADVLAAARRRGEDIGSQFVLPRYAQWRRADVAALVAATDGVNSLFSNDNPVLRGMRDIGMGVVNALPGLRRGFMREAAGLQGELPRLLRGLRV